MERIDFSWFSYLWYTIDSSTIFTIVCSRLFTTDSFLFRISYRLLYVFFCLYRIPFMDEGILIPFTTERLTLSHVNHIFHAYYHAPCTVIPLLNHVYYDWVGHNCNSGHALKWLRSIYSHSMYSSALEKGTSLSTPWCCRLKHFKASIYKRLVWQRLTAAFH